MIHKLVYLPLFLMSLSISAKGINDNIKFVFPNVAATGATVSIDMKGVFLNGTIDVLDAPKDSVGYVRDAVSLLTMHVEAHKSQQISEIVKNWSVHDRSNIYNLFSDSETLNNSSARFKALSSMKVISIFHYEKYLVTIVNYQFFDSNFKFHYVMIREDEGLKLTNKLSEDALLNNLVDILSKSTEKNIVKSK